MSRYQALAPYYDRLMTGVDYAAWADYYQRMFESRGLAPRLILDLACGTGTLTCLLADRGYEMIGADASEDMLMVAQARPCTGVRPLFLHQRMEQLDLYGTVQAVLCSLDGMNYLPRQMLGQALSRIHLFLEPGGLLIFDINTVDKFARLDGETFVSEADGIFCVWRCAYNAQERENQFTMDIFTKTGAMWRRTQEEHIEYAYTRQEMEAALRKAGFQQIACYGELSDTEPVEGEERIFFVAER